jgi:hypothetical protein
MLSVVWNTELRETVDQIGLHINLGILELWISCL